MSLSHGYTRFMLAVLLLGALLVALLTVLTGSSPVVPVPTGTHVLIAEVYYDTYRSDKSEQFVRVYNATADEVDLSGWTIGDGKRQVLFHAGIRLRPGASLYVAREAWAFLQEMGHPPDFEYGGDTVRDVPDLLAEPAPPVWPSLGGAVILRDENGDEVDVVVYGDGGGGGGGGGYQGAGWHGASVPRVGQRGEIMDRARDEATITARSAGLFVPDTNTAADWWQGSAWKDLRVYQRGQTFMPYPTFQARSVTAYSSPDSTYRTLASLIDGARYSLDLCVYEFHLVELAEKVAAAARRGVKVRLLLEGAPVGGVADQGRYVAKLITDAGGEVRYLIHDSQNEIWSRFAFLHAKFGVVDGRKVFAQSENFKATGTPADPTAGNRGWGIVVESDDLAAYLQAVFEADWDPAFADSFPYTAGTLFGAPAPGFIPDRTIPAGQYPQPFPALTMQGPIDITPVLAPDHALLETKGINGLIRSARHTLLIEQQYAQVFCARCHIRWWKSCFSRTLCSVITR